jgi:putative membrane protein
MTHRTFVVAAIVATLAVPALAQEKPARPPAADAGKAAGSATSTKALNTADQNFIKEAAGAGMAEVELGKMVGGKAQSESVKRFAQHMIEDHSKANDDLMAIAKQLNYTPPKQVSAEEQSLQRKLAALEGPKFEQAYMESQVKAHQKAVQLFQHQATAGQNAELKKFAATTLLKLNQHLQMAQQVTAEAGKGASKVEPAAGGKGTTTSTGEATSAKRSEARSGDRERGKITELNRRELQRVEGGQSR